MNGAGMVVFKKNCARPEIIVLRREDGEHDLPKGHLEEDEEPIDCALRETREETGLSASMPWGEECGEFGSCTFYAGEAKGEPKVRENPETGEAEHEWAGWMPLDEALLVLPDWMIDVVEWANVHREDRTAMREFVGSITARP